MRMLQSGIATAFVFTFFVLFSAAQEPVKPVYVVGELTGMSADKLTVAAKAGDVEVLTTGTTVYKRIPPAEKISLGAAIDGQRSEIGVGDKLTISALPSPDGKLTARTVFFSTKADLATKNAKEAEEWRTRGINGKVVSVDTANNVINIETGALMAKTAVKLTPKPNAKLLRYAPDSIKFSDAKLSSLVDIKPGDQLRALGERSADGTAFTAETVLTGGFRQIAGTVVSVDVTGKEAVIKDIGTNKDMTVAFGDAVLLKRFPEEMAQRMMAMQMGGAPGGVRPLGAQGPPQGASPTTTSGQPGQGQGRSMNGGGPRGGLDEMVERAPNITAAELKVGEMIAVLTAAPDATSTAAARVKAIKLIAGVEPFVRMAQAAAASGGPRQGGGVSGNFSIPGLDGTGF
jgi:hypothetical protein